MIVYVLIVQMIVSSADGLSSKIEEHEAAWFRAIEPCNQAADAFSTLSLNGLEYVAFCKAKEGA